MNKEEIKNFAIWARQKLIKDVTRQAGMVGISEKGIAAPLPQSTEDLQFFDIGTPKYTEISGERIWQRESLTNILREKEENMGSYEKAFHVLIEEVAYTWFNRLIAIRFMEVNDYLPSRIRVLSSEIKDKKEPDIVTHPFDAELEYTKEEEKIITFLQDKNQTDTLFRTLFIKQCNALHDILPELFEKTDDYSELLLSLSCIDEDGVVYRLVHDINEDDFNVQKEGQVEIIGWLYQYYNIEPKAEVFARAKAQKIQKEDIPAVTQLFTPHWIVRYMVENSLGRLWVDGHPNQSPKIQWDYYVEEAEQDENIKKALEKIRREDAVYTPETIKLIDPCMGSGHILVYAFDVFMQIYQKANYQPRDAAAIILEKNLYGADIDKRAYQIAYFSLMMKARQYDRRILTRGILPNLIYTKNSTALTDGEKEKLGSCREIALQLIANFKDVEEYGSLVQSCCTMQELDELENQLQMVEKKKNISDLMEAVDVAELQHKLFPLIRQARILNRKYQVVITNPPYMAVNKGNKRLKEYVWKNYPDSKADLFSVFMERCQAMVVPQGFQAMITMQSWMFLTSFQKLREKFLNMNMVSMIHLGARAFEEIDGEVVQTTSFVFRNINLKGYKGIYCRLVDAKTQQKKEEMFLEGENRFVKKNDVFGKIWGTPIIYWISQALLLDLRKGKSVSCYAQPKQGMSTCDVNRFTKLWFEVSVLRTNIYDSSNKTYWVRYNKGGSFRKWYGNKEYIVYWGGNGEALLANGALLRNRKMYFKPFLAWTKIASMGTGFRKFEDNYLFDGAGGSLFLNTTKITENYLLGLLNSKVGMVILSLISPTLNFNEQHIGAIPVIKAKDSNITNQIEKLVRYTVSISKKDWDSFETSWDFQIHPLVKMVSPKAWNGTPYGKVNFSLESMFQNLKEGYNDCFAQLKANEEQLNRIFIDIYGLQDELTPEVPDSEVTVHRVFDRKEDISGSMGSSLYVLTKQDVIKSFISYAVGCMLGRYSLDVEGLAYAGGAWDSSRYKTFLPDEDNCIPITDEEYFSDDIVGRFVEFVRIVYGTEDLEENLTFIAEALGNKGKTSREIIRSYFLQDFMKDHIKKYQKRPIYWMFDSGKENGFKALCYMHRWNADTIGNMRMEYLQRTQKVYEKEIERMQETIDFSQDNQEIRRAVKRKEKLEKQLREIRGYDEKVAHLALARISIDLDDGVKVNYEKVQTDREGHKQQILTKI